MRTIWNGSISFGLVNIPIGLALATPRTDVAFRTLHRAQGGARTLETLLFRGDVRPKSETEDALGATEVRKQDLGLARQVIESLVGEWHPVDFENEYRRDLKTMLEAKLAGETLVRPEPVAETPVIDLMEALRRSVAEVQDRKSNGSGAKAPKKTKATPSEGGSGSQIG